MSFIKLSKELFNHCTLFKSRAAFRASKPLAAEYLDIYPNMTFNAYLLFAANLFQALNFDFLGFYKGEIKNFSILLPTLKLEFNNFFWKNT